MKKYLSLLLALCLTPVSYTHLDVYKRQELMDRAHLTVSGVEDVERFDESGVIMTTSAGTLIVTGEDLHIGKLSLEGGELYVDGRITSISYCLLYTSRCV